MAVRVDRVSRVRVARDVISSEPSRTSGIWDDQKILIFFLAISLE